MKEPFLLSKRLSKCAEFIPENTRLIDIGTDHGYLPIWLLKTGKIKSAVATDIRTGPLSEAIKNADKYAADIKFVLSDGFEKISYDSFDTAVIAGMGGELIADILEKKQENDMRNKIFILQPMTKSEKLRDFLYKNKYTIKREEAVKDKEHIYSVMNVEFAGTFEKHEDIDLWMGMISPGTEESTEYASKIIKRLKKIEKGYIVNSSEYINLVNIEHEIVNKYL
jgi:tRNA (adenine22-N1)-methyltransferase